MRCIEAEWISVYLSVYQWTSETKPKLSNPARYASNPHQKQTRKCIQRSRRSNPPVSHSGNHKNKPRLMVARQREEQQAEEKKPSNSPCSRGGWRRRRGRRSRSGCLSRSGCSVSSDELDRKSMELFGGMKSLPLPEPLSLPTPFSLPLLVLSCRLSAATKLLELDPTLLSAAS